MNAGSQRLCAWGGPVLIVLFVLGWGVIGGFLPPPDPTATAADTVRFFETDPTAIRLGLLMCMTGAAFLGLWTAAISVQLKRIEGRHSPLTYAQLALGSVSIVEFVTPLLIWQACAYRPADDPMITQRFNDLAWLMWVAVDASFVLQAIVIGVAILKDERADPVFPRWLAYMCFWSALLFCPGGLCVFFKAGPFDWGGLIAFWLLAAAYVTWVITMTVVLLKRSIPQHERQWEAEDAPARATSLRH